MRKSTKTAVGAISLGILGLSYQLGTTATASTGGFASPINSASASAAPSSSTAPDPNSSASVAPGSQGSETLNTPQPAVSASASASASAAPTPSATKSSNTSASSSVTKSGDSIESGFGPVQVKVTKVDGKITDITYLQSIATHGRAAAFPYLVQYAIQANGTNFSNLSGATFTTNAFKESLRTALAKF